MIVYLNGKYTEKERAMISVDDRGFLFADGLYEMILSYQGRPFRLKRHLARLEHGCEFIRLNLSNIDFIEDICFQLIKKNDLTSKIAAIYIELTRGTYKRAHQFPPADISPTIYISASEFLPDREHQRKGIATITVQDRRWGRCDIKTINLLPNVLEHQKAIESGGHEAIFVRDGIMLEGTHSNVFAFMNGELMTHPVTERVLPGINREAVFELCERLNIGISEKPIAMNDLENLEEAFITSTTLEIMPVIKIDNIVIANGEPGRITKSLQKEFRILTGQEP
jgi:D-alanine transaminase